MSVVNPLPGGGGSLLPQDGWCGSWAHRGHSSVESSAFGESVKLMKNDTSVLSAIKNQVAEGNMAPRLDPGTKDMTGTLVKSKYIWRLVHGTVSAP